MTPTLLPNYDIKNRKIFNDTYLCTFSKKVKDCLMYSEFYIKINYPLNYNYSYYVKCLHRRGSTISSYTVLEIWPNFYRSRLSALAPSNKAFLKFLLKGWFPASKAFFMRFYRLRLPLRRLSSREIFL